jgi:TonB family protein
MSRFEVSGGLDASTIRRTIRRQLSAVRHCYQTELQSHPRLQGTVTLAFVILRDGRVGASRIARSTLNNRAVESCILRLARRWLFSEADAEAYTDRRPYVTYPFHFINRSLATLPATEAPVRGA